MDQSKMLNDLKRLIAVQSVMGEAAPDAPFGPGPKAALDEFLGTAASYGMRTHNENGYCGWAEIGSGETCIGILGHLDVVPAGDGWSHPPYSLVCEDGLLYGRGVADDKGATVAALHALKDLQDGNAPLRHRIRLICGCNEENGSACIEYYRTHCELPVASFVPDADFPLINSEKGILHLSLALAADKEFALNISSFSAGLRPNMIPAACLVKVPASAPLHAQLCALGSDSSLFLQPKIARAIVDAGFRPEDYSVHFFEREVQLEARGVAGHASTPERGENAVYKMIALLSALLPASTTLGTLKACFASGDPAAALGIAASDDVSGSLTVNLGLIGYEKGTLTLTLDLRLPVCADRDRVEAAIAKATGGTPKEARWSPNLYVPKDSKLVSALLRAYGAVTHEKAECKFCGGGTYARELPNAVAFGPTFPGLETNLHNADECFPLELLCRLPEIYKQAILELDEAYA